MKEGFSEQGNLLGIGITISLIVVLSFFIDIEKMKEWVLGVGIWAPLAFIFLKILTLVIAPISGGPLYPLAGVLFGFWPGLIFIAIGDFIGYTLCFGLSRMFGQKLVERLLGRKEESLLPKIVDHISTSKGFFQAALALLISPELLSYGAGLSKLSYVKFIFILWPMYLVISILLVWLGSSLDPSSEPGIILSIIPFLGITCVLIGGTLFIKTMRNKA